MSERIIVKGEDLDLYESEGLSLNIKLNDISQISTRNSTYSNTSKVPNTSRNARIFEYLGLIGNGSAIPYKKTKCQYLKNEVPIIEDGYIQVTKTTDDDFFIVIYEGVIDLTQRLGDKKINELTGLSVYNHTRSRAVVVGSLTNESGYIYALQHNVKDSIYALGISGEGLAVVDKMFPVFFVKTIFIMILQEAGYSYEGEIFDDPEFAEEVFTMFRGSENDYINFSLMLEPIKQTDFLKEVLNQYGLVMRLKKNTLEFRAFNDIAKGSFGRVDLTKKLVKVKDEIYDGGYAQKNLFTFNYSDQLNTRGDGFLYVPNENIKDKEEAYKSIFDFNSAFVLYRLFFDVGELSSLLVPSVPLIDVKINNLGEEEFKPLTFKSGIYRLNRTGGDFELKDSEEEAYSTVVGLETLLSTDLIKWQYKLNKGFARLQNILTNFKKVLVEFNFSEIDIYNLDLFKIYFFSDKGQYYYINSLKLNNSVTTAELIQINGLLEENAVIIPPDEAAILITALNAYLANPPFTFAGGIVTNYKILGYQPLSLVITYTQLDAENGNPTGLVYTGNCSTDISEAGTYNNQQIPYLYQPETSGWYVVKIKDPETLIESNEMKIFLGSEAGVNPPEFFVQIENASGVDPTRPLLRMLSYRFKYFNPTFAKITIQAKNIITGANVGSPTVLNLTNLTVDVFNNVPNVPFNNGQGYYSIKTESNDYLDEFTTFIF